MGAQCTFDEMLPTIESEANGIDDPHRQVEVFTYGGGLFLRIGQVNDENTGTNRYTVQLSKRAAEMLISGIQDGVDYFSLSGFPN